MKFRQKIAPVLLGLGVTGILAVLAVVFGAYFYLLPSLPSAETMRDVELQTPLRVYSRDGRLMAQIGEKRRTPVEYDEIPEIVIQAFLAAEDDRFFEHPGFDYQGILRAALNLMVTGSRSQGGSTITQQLARVYFLTRERTFIRKAKELILAVQIEHEFSKEEILALYLNKIFLGQRAYGVGAAAEVYFGKPLQELNVAEAATIAGLPKAPSNLNPVAQPVAARERRAYVLRRMLELDFIDRAQYEGASASPVESRLHGPNVELAAPYVTEMVRAEMVERFGQGVYTAGYSVTTTIDGRLQEAAENALQSALLEYDRRHGFRGPVERRELPTTDEDVDAIDALVQSLLSDYPVNNSLHVAQVLALEENNSASIYIRDFGRVSLPWQNIKWRAFINDDVVGDTPEHADQMIQPGDVVYVMFTANQGWVLAQMPIAQGAFVALDPHDGATIALTGGFDFFTSKFNRAVQSKRQPGSSFKPFIYSAALENGFTTSTLVNDAPVVFDDDNLEDTWRPENYSRKFNGPTRLREALVKSLNLVSVRILRGTGLGPALEHIRPFGFPASALPRDLSLALGSGGASPWEMAAGYATFANGGYRVEKYLIEQIFDSNGEVVWQSEAPVVCEECAPEWFDDESTDRVQGQPEDQSPPTIETATAPTDADVPHYQNVEQMMEHGMSWRPTAKDAPGFVEGQVKKAERIISAENAYLVYDMMRDVIQRGTGRRARELGRPDLAGKTGTSNERRDAWFSGYNSHLVATAWVGFDQDRSLGAGEEGSRTALPVWKYFMEKALAETPTAIIPQPPGIVTVRIVPESGLVAPAGRSDAIFEIFEEGRVPELAAEDTSVDFGYGLDDFSADDESLF